MDNILEPVEIPYNSKRLEGSKLIAVVPDRNGENQESSIELNNYIENINGTLTWRPYGNFIATSRNLQLDGWILRCQSLDYSKAWRNTSIHLLEKIKNFNGKLIYKFEHAVVHVDKNNEKEALELINDMYNGHKETISVQAAELDGGSKVLYINAGVGKDEGVIMQLSAEIAASVFHQVGKGTKIETVEFDIIQTKLKAWAGQAGLGIGVSANLIDGKASVFDFTLGVGIDTGMGIEDDSFTFKALGCGITLGRKVAISVFGTSFGVDFGRCLIL